MKIKKFNEEFTYANDWEDEFSNLEFTPPKDFKIDLEDWIKHEFYREASIFIEMENGTMYESVWLNGNVETREISDEPLYGMESIDDNDKILNASKNITKTHIGKVIKDYIESFKEDIVENVYIIGH